MNPPPISGEPSGQASAGRPGPIANEPSKSSQPGQNRPMISRRRLGFGVVCGLLVCGAAFLAYHAFASPRHSLEALVAAVRRQDRQTVAVYVDADSMAASIRRLMLDAFRRDQEKNRQGDFVARLLNPLGEQIADKMVNATVTPDAVISRICGDAPGEIVKRGLGNWTDGTVDGITKNGSPEAHGIGLGAKVLFRWVEGLAVNEADAHAASQTSKAETGPCDVAMEYEGFSRYVITVKEKNSMTPPVSVVMTRAGLCTWRLTELRMVPGQNAQLEARNGR